MIIPVKKHRFELGSLPIIGFMSVMVGVPLIYIFFLSFMTRGENGSIVYQFTLQNYARIFEPLYLRILGVSVVIAVLTSLLTLIIGYPFAYFTARLNPKIRFFVLLLVLMPFWTSSLLRTYGFMILLRTEGVINSFLLWANLIDKPLKLIYNYGAVLTGTVYMLLPFMILPVYNSVEKLDNSLIEASYDLGAGRFRTFVNITLPLTLPGIVGGVTLVFIPAVGLYFISDLLGGAKTMLLGNLISNQVGGARNWPFAAALSVVIVAGMLLFVWLYNNVTKITGKDGGLF